METSDLKFVNGCLSSDRLRIFSVSALILLAGVILGLLLDVNENVPKPYNRISSIIGWVYFMCWSISFYPQVILNYQRKTVVGLSLDYTVLNLLGFACYAAFNCSFYFSSIVQQQYIEQHHGNRNAVELNDVFFSLHAAALTAVSLYQCAIYPQGDQRISKATLTWTSATIVTSLVFGLAIWISGNPSCSFFKVINLLYLLSYVKLCTTLTKNIPQILLNQSRQSTVGWNIWNVLLDIAGGILSVGQQVLDSWSTNDWAAITGNPVKFGLGFVSIVVDTVFIVQHFVLYTERHHVMDKREKRPLLAETIYDLEKC
uniref:Lysosomal Cystine Transporter (LCT) Family putative n=1 Tax=Albugo laibachii Nc14 TaxID=890382 RepID=F0W7I6_9STRA|nr:Lysosomal Cystine Transporter (LCT) Family putative [Albugo laibachii Nc14]|eukprot:CCA17087.1 Lysosomal Cystine Transporter (LCT) Family putative [Albugo laibachii Nc14]